MPKADDRQEKQEIEKLLNEIFGTNIKWSRLSKGDLNQLLVVLTKHQQYLCEKLCSDYTPKGTIVRLIDQIIPPEHQGPLIKGFKSLISMASRKEGTVEQETGET